MPHNLLNCYPNAMPNNTNALWSLVWKVNQILVPIIVAWAVWVTAQQYRDIAHRDKPHAGVPIEYDQFVVVQMSLVRLEEGLLHLKTDVAEIKKKLN